ncbi:MAG: hypothetical protein WBZ51_35565, partial [Xanthobacteraceae bacterium]
VYLIMRGIQIYGTYDVLSRAALRDDATANFNIGPSFSWAHRVLHQLFLPLGRVFLLASGRPRRRRL